MPDVKLWNGAALKSLRRVLAKGTNATLFDVNYICLLYTSPSPRDQRGDRMKSE